MTTPTSQAYTCFAGHQRIASGSLVEIAHIVQQTTAQGTPDPILIFDDRTGRSIDLDPSGLTGVNAPVVSDYEHQAEQLEQVRGKGRPKLGVISREVTLLPRHWDWLAAQPGGASVALRKLIEEARRNPNSKDLQRRRQERAYQFISAIGGNFLNFEEATRALFADDRDRFTDLIASWSADIRTYAIRLAFEPTDTDSREDF